MCQKYCISIDWLQVYCKCNLNEMPASVNVMGMSYEIKRLERVTPLWQEVYVIRWQNRDIAELCRSPRSSALDRFGCTVKLANRVLYSTKWLPILKGIISVLGLKYVGITRLDLCADCNVLAGGRSVDSFLSDFLSHTPLAPGHIIRSGSRKLTIQATRDKTGFTRISGMRWGSSSNDVGAYCYNKSLELLEVKDKPWIRETWERNGLVNAWTKEQWDELPDKMKQKKIELGDSMDFVQTPVWRFEISIKGHAKDLLHLDTGELFKLSLDAMEQEYSIHDIFFYYAAKYLDFRINTGQKRLRDYVSLQLFEDSPECTMRPVNINLYADTGRTEKIAANLLQKVQATYGDLEPSQRGSIEFAIAFLRTISGAKAGIVRMKKELAYCNHMKATKFAQTDITFYLDFVEYAHKQKGDFDTQTGYNFIQSLISEVKQDNERESIRGLLSEYTPVW